MKREKKICCREKNKTTQEEITASCLLLSEEQKQSNVFSTVKIIIVENTNCFTANKERELLAGQAQRVHQVHFDA